MASNRIAVNRVSVVRMINMDDLVSDTEIVELLGDRHLWIYLRLWSIAEDWGGYAPKFKDIKYKMGAFEFTAEEVEQTINKLIKAKKIVEVEVNGVKIHWIVAFLKRQSPPSSRLSELPLPNFIHCTVTEDHYHHEKYSYSVVVEECPVKNKFKPGDPNTIQVSELDPEKKSEKPEVRKRSPGARKTSRTQRKITPMGVGDGEGVGVRDLEVGKGKGVEVVGDSKGESGQGPGAGKGAGEGETPNGTATAQVREGSVPKETILEGDALEADIMLAKEKGEAVYWGWDIPKLEMVLALVKKNDVVFNLGHIKFLSTVPSAQRFEGVQTLIAAAKKRSPQPAGTGSG
jgi:hypothetical protein